MQQIKRERVASQRGLKMREVANPIFFSVLEGL